MLGIDVILILGVVGLLVFFLADLLLKRKILNPKLRKATSLVAAIGITPILYIGFIVGMIAYMEYYPKSEFDKNQWKLNEEERFLMSKDIIQSEILLGKSRAEVIEILGDDFSNDRDDLISYYIGHVPGIFNIDPDIIEVHFQENKVIEVSQRGT